MFYARICASYYLGIFSLEQKPGVYNDFWNIIPSMMARERNGYIGIFTSNYPILVTV
jgi:hypothetical protein